MDHRTQSQAEHCLEAILNQPECGPCTIESISFVDGVHEVTVICQDSVMSFDVKVTAHTLRKEEPHVE